MKLVTYVVKEDELNLHSIHTAGARIGWLTDEWVIDIGFAQQWLSEKGQVTFAQALPVNLTEWFARGQQDFDVIQHMANQLKTEDPERLWVQGEPVAIPIDEAYLLAPWLEPETLCCPVNLQITASHPPLVISDSASIAAHQFLPGVAYLINDQRRVLGCCLVNYWFTVDNKLIAASLSSVLITADELIYGAEQVLSIWQNEKFVAQVPIILESHVDGAVKMEAFVSHSPCTELLAVQPGDDIRIEMEVLGQLRNRVDKSEAIQR